MGNNNSVQQKFSNDEIITNINKLFESYQHADVDTIQSLNMSTVGGCFKCDRNRYAEFETQLGGSLRNAENIIKFDNLAKFANLSGGSTEQLEELDFDNNFVGGNYDALATSTAFMSELANNGVLSATSNAVIPEAKTNTTSNMFMSDLANVNNLSATSPVVMNGGCGCDLEKKLAEEQFVQKHTSPKQPSTSILDSLTDMANIVPSQNGGCSACTSSLKLNSLVGGTLQTSEEMNIMPFYSSTSGTEYYGNMQKSHRYT